MEEMRKLYQLFWENDCTLLEINPFIETPNGEGFHLSASLSCYYRAWLFLNPPPCVSFFDVFGMRNTVLCADCKLNFDDSAAHRHKELFALRVSHVHLYRPFFSTVCLGENF